jgi:hypothetical protein
MNWRILVVVLVWTVEMIVLGIYVARPALSEMSAAMQGLVHQPISNWVLAVWVFPGPIVALFLVGWPLIVARYWAEKGDPL